MEYKLIIGLTEDNLKAKKLVISVESKKQATVVYHSLRANGNTVKAEMSKDVTFN